MAKGIVVPFEHNNKLPSLILLTTKNLLETETRVFLDSHECAA